MNCEEGVAILLAGTVGLTGGFFYEAMQLPIMYLMSPVCACDCTAQAQTGGVDRRQIDGLWDALDH